MESSRPILNSGGAGCEHALVFDVFLEDGARHGGDDFGLLEIVSHVGDLRGQAVDFGFVDPPEVLVVLLGILDPLSGQFGDFAGLLGCADGQGGAFTVVLSLTRQAFGVVKGGLAHGSLSTERSNPLQLLVGFAVLEFGDRLFFLGDSFGVLGFTYAQGGRFQVLFLGLHGIDPVDLGSGLIHKCLRPFYLLLESEGIDAGDALAFFNVVPHIEFEAFDSARDRHGDQILVRQTGLCVFRDVFADRPYRRFGHLDRNRPLPHSQYYDADQQNDHNAQQDSLRHYPPLANALFTRFQHLDHVQCADLPPYGQIGQYYEQHRHNAGRYESTRFDVVRHAVEFSVVRHHDEFAH